MAQNEMTAAPGQVREEKRSSNGPESAINVGQTERLVTALAGGAMAAYGISKRNPAGIALALMGGTLLVRGATGHCPVYQAIGASTVAEDEHVHIEDSVTINQPRTALFGFWREFANLAQIFPGIESVIPVGDTQHHWVAHTPDGRKVTWDTEIIAEKKNALITWRTLPDSPVKHTASVRFVTVPHGRGTETRMSIEYTAPGGKLTHSLAQILSSAPETMLHESLRRFKQLMETGEVPTVKGQPKGT